MSDYVTRRKLGEQPLWRHGKPLLGRIDVELTERCDNDCLHCCICKDDGGRRAGALRGAAS